MGNSNDDLASDDAFYLNLNKERKRLRSTNLFFLEIIFWEGIRTIALLTVIKVIEEYCKFIHYSNDLIFSVIDNFGTIIGLVLWAILSLFFLNRHWKTIKGEEPRK